MKTLIFLILTIAAGYSMAQTHSVRRGDVFIGDELYNEHKTGNICYITINGLQEAPERGLHCYSIDFAFASIREDIPKEVLKVDSRITNYHRPEYPNFKTCAMNVNGTTSGDDIYGEDTANLYNQIFGGAHSTDSVQNDYFLTLSSKSKTVVRARIHVLKTFSEYNVDCVNLQKM